MRRAALLSLPALLCLPLPARAYPTDTAAQELTSIRRLKWQQDINDGKRKGRTIPEGARWPSSAVALRMLDNPSYDVTAETQKDPALQAALEAILKRGSFRRYNVALLDISNPAAPRYAAVNETEQETPGSVAKVLLAAGMFQALADRFGSDLEGRRELLRHTMVSADEWVMPNHHEVPVIAGDVSGEGYTSHIRKVLPGDVFSLYEWMDHALSPSSNACASMLWREAALLRLLGAEYPPARRDAALFGRWDRDAFTTASFETVDAPLAAAGLDVEDFNVRMYFTNGANRYIRSGPSRASPLGLLRWLLRVEQGRMVDAFSSLELKRMLYLTRRRVRYVKTPVLEQSAVFFKTGSLFKCAPEPGFTCVQYEGNVVNVLNAMVVVETPAPEPEPASAPDPTGTAMPAASAPDGSRQPAVRAPSASPAAPRWVYIVAVMSNELRRNAAEDHGRLAAAIHEAIKAPSSVASSGTELPPGSR